MQKSCKHCGDKFVADKEWKTMCVPCYIKWKKASEEPVTTEKKVEVVYVFDLIPEEIIDRLIRLCHPDKHKNSKASTEATQWLLYVRDEQRKNREAANEQ